MEPDYRTAGLLTMLWWSVVLGLLIRLASAIVRFSAASPRAVDAPGAMPRALASPAFASPALASPDRLVPDVSMPSRAEGAPRAGRIQRPRRLRMPPAEPIAVAEPGLIPISIRLGPDHARPLAPADVDSPCPVPKNCFWAPAISHALFVPIAQRKPTAAGSEVNIHAGRRVSLSHGPAPPPRLYPAECPPR